MAAEGHQHPCSPLDSPDHTQVKHMACTSSVSHTGLRLGGIGKEVGPGRRQERGEGQALIGEGGGAGLDRRGEREGRAHRGAVEPGRP